MSDDLSDAELDALERGAGDLGETRALVAEVRRLRAEPAEWAKAGTDAVRVVAAELAEAKAEIDRLRAQAAGLETLTRQQSEDLLTCGRAIVGHEAAVRRAETERDQLRQQVAGHGWTATTPTVPGRYWWRNPDYEYPPTRKPYDMIVVRRQDCEASKFHGMLVVDYGATQPIGEFGGEWAGPLLPPA